MNSALPEQNPIEWCNPLLVKSPLCAGCKDLCDKSPSLTFQISYVSKVVFFSISSLI